MKTVFQIVIRTQWDGDYTRGIYTTLGKAVYHASIISERDTNCYEATGEFEYPYGKILIFEKELDCMNESINVYDGCGNKLNN